MHNSSRRQHRRLMGSAALLSLMGSLHAAGQVQHQPEAAKPTATQPAKAMPEFLQVVEQKGKRIALQIASRDYKRPDGTGPTIGLVGVAHIGERNFYRAIEKLLEQYEVVLYESVKPPGAGGAGGETDEEKIESTKAAMQFVGGLIESFKNAKGEYPPSFEELEQYAAEEDPRVVEFLRTALKDAWGRTFIYETIVPPAPAPAPEAGAPAPEDGAAALPPYSLISLGADGAPAGEGPNADITLADQQPPDPLMLSKEDGLQSQLAEALNLEFQLDALAYDQPNWRCSDMAMDEVSRRLKNHGVDFEGIGGTLAGSSMPAKIIKVLLGMMRVADTFFEGAIADTFKVVMIEMLGDERLINQSMIQFGEGFAEVILHDRNQVAIDDLKKLIEQEPDVKSVAVLYGAAHMPDLAKRMHEQLGYEPTAAEDIRWMTAIEVNLEQSAIAPSEMNQIRLMVRRAIRQQLRQPR